MYEQITTLLGQILIMFLLMAAGYLIYRLKILNNDGTRQLSALLAKVVAPCIILSSFQREYDPVLGKTLAITLICAFLTLLIGVAISCALYRPAKYKNFANRQMCATFSNNGFMALPLLEAMFGSLGVFLGSAHIVAANVLTWTYGVRQLTQGKAKFRARNIFLNPGALALFFGVLLFLSPVKLPVAVASTVTYIGSLNTPLAMLVLGCFLAQSDLLASLRDIDILKISAVRLLLIPLVTMLFLFFTPLDTAARTILLIGFSAPVAVAAATFAQMYDSDYLFCARAVAVSTLLSALTLPLMIAIFSVVTQML